MNFIKRHADLIASVLLIAAVAFYAARYINWNLAPYEDAAMLMRYADHLARGYGIVWNIGEHPVDGATDFLFMAAVAALVKIGIAVGRSVRILGFGAHIFTVLLVYFVNRKIWKANVSISFLTALFLAVGNGLPYVAAFFGTPFFALFAALTWTFALLLIQKENPPLWFSLLLALTGLITGLIRPDGVIIAGLMLLSIIVMKGWRASTKTIFAFVGIFLIFGGAYFLWRWNYFGYPLPNPFYKKGGGTLHMDSFDESIGNMFRLAAPFWLAFVLALRSKKTTKQALAFLIPIAGFASAFILISNEMNFGGRFQYAIVPIILMSWFPLVDGLGSEIGFSWPKPLEVRARAAWVFVALVASYMMVLYSASQKCYLVTGQQSCDAPNSGDGRYDLAQVLAEYQGKGYVIATSEAGLLPFYSGWTALDTWGLNDQWIAHHGDITPEYLDQYKPNIIVFHAYFSPLVPPKLTDANLAQDWFRMTITLKDYAESHGYVLAAVFGDSPYDTHYYYVRSDFADSKKIINAIDRFYKYKGYIWELSGKKSINYAEISKP
jgi:hypothetical protein